MLDRSEHVVGDRCTRLKRDRSVRSITPDVGIVTDQCLEQQSPRADPCQWQSECCWASDQFTVAAVQSDQHAGTADCC